VTPLLFVFTIDKTLFFIFIRKFCLGSSHESASLILNLAPQPNLPIVTKLHNLFTKRSNFTKFPTRLGSLTLTSNSSPIFDRRARSRPFFPTYQTFINNGGCRRRPTLMTRTGAFSLQTTTIYTQTRPMTVNYLRLGQKQSNCVSKRFSNGASSSITQRFQRQSITTKIRQLAQQTYPVVLLYC
jgi:hypothetical protein